MACWIEPWMQRNENKRFRKDGLCILEYDYKNESTEENLGRQWSILLENFWKLFKAEELEYYSTMDDNKAAFAERTKQSLKKYFPVTWKFLKTRTFTIFFKSSNPWNPAKQLDKLDSKELLEFPLFVASLHQDATRI